MARDEALLAAAAERRTAALRFYGWRPAALSIGYFQRWADFRRFHELDLPVVRRPSGGGAIWCGAGPFPRRAGAIFEKLHLCICRGLSRLGLDARLSDGPAGPSPLICFSAPQKYDIVAGGRKLLGSAQRRKRGAFLQHGSLPLSPNRFAPGAASLGEVLAGAPPEEAVVAALKAGFEEGLGLSFETGRLAGGEEDLARRLAHEKYGADEWNRRR